MAVYFLQNALGHIKIGTSNNPIGRCNGFRTGNSVWDGFEILRVIDGGRAKESELHRKFAHCKIGDNGKELDGEWHYPRPELLDYINGVSDCPEYASAQAQLREKVIERASQGDLTVDEFKIFNNDKTVMDTYYTQISKKYRVTYQSDQNSINQISSQLTQLQQDLSVNENRIKNQFRLQASQIRELIDKVRSEQDQALEYLESKIVNNGHNTNSSIHDQIKQQIKHQSNQTRQLIDELKDERKQVIKSLDKKIETAIQDLNEYAQLGNKIQQQQQTLQNQLEKTTNTKSDQNARYLEDHKKLNEMLIQQQSFIGQQQTQSVLRVQRIGELEHQLTTRPVFNRFWKVLIGLTAIISLSTSAIQIKQIFEAEPERQPAIVDQT